MSALLELEGVKRTVILPDGSPLPILRGVDMSVQRGEHVAILGRSGSGKTTLLNLLGLIDRQSEGSLRFDGVDVATLSESRRARMRGTNIGFVFQQFNLLESRTALENVVMPLLYAGGTQFWHRTQLAQSMLEHVGLGQRADQRPNRLSGGEQQRVAVARALVRRPSLLLADEPTGALDVATGQAIMDLLAQRSREAHAALITITHDLHVASLADRVLLLDQGVLTAVDLTQAAHALAASDGINPGVSV